MILALAAVLLLCPPSGSATSAWERHANLLKNRTGTPVQFSRLSVEDLLHSDPEAYADYASAELEGWVMEVHKAGPESCNCFDPKRVDTHILLGSTRRTRAHSQAVIVEVTPRRPVAIRGIVGRHVLVRGWLFYDGHHVHERGRGTAWEVHPVTSIRVLE